MYYVYILRSLRYPQKTYIGFTRNLKLRLERHNSGFSMYTRQYLPWEILTYIAFHDMKLAMRFEKYLKIGSGKAFAKKRLY